MVYRDTGIWTTLCLLLIAINNEIIACALCKKANKPNREIGEK
jgi:hypothetical protein